tara:strand:+ start:1573 stop:2142 length:570 start_codon:yes stop_codon:yes gene_type:complete
METKKVKRLDLKIWDVKQQIPVIKKATTGFKFKYTNLGDVEKALRPILVKNKVGYRHKTIVIDSQNILKTIVFCLESDEEEHIDLLIPSGVLLTGMNGYQSLGSALTYFKRYNLLTAFGVLTDDDVDAQNPQKKVKEPEVKTDHYAQIVKLQNVGRPKSTLEKYFSMYAKDMSEDQKTKAKDFISKVTK